MVTRFTEATDSPAASALQDKLAQVTEHFGRLCQQQQEREDALKGLLPKVEQYEQLWEKLQQFTDSRSRVLASGNQPDRDIAHFSQHIQVRRWGRSFYLRQVSDQALPSCGRRGMAFPGSQAAFQLGSVGRILGSSPNVAGFYQLKAPWG